jgi:hypothetical protein
VSTATATKAPEVEAASLAASVLTSDLPTNEVSITVKERTYVIRELSVAAFLSLGAVIAQEAESLSKAGLLKEAVWQDLGKSGDYSDLVSRVALVWAHVPNVCGRALSLIMGGEHPDDPEYILANITPRQLLQIIRAFMRTNPWQDMVEDFFRLRQEAANAFQRIPSSGES